MSASHKRRERGPPPMTVGGGGTISHISYNAPGNSQTHRTVRARLEPGPTTAEASRTPWEEDVATLQARSDPNFSYSLGDGSLSSQADQQDVGESGIVVVIAERRNQNHYIQYIFCKRYIKYQTVVLQKLPGSGRHPGAVSGILDNQVNSRSGDD
ncbi:hypothetical protein FB45DRAFT_999912 [Roridomyces roridus]|uniref:Uncharacterized protein n=1 Tax=Roridomyces roridus TaxID=1738132 RepID=A0AAD7C781_9AGAR|nr:hypothetical protein FB45DRAFT_999912 [Roridomyces roridus]